MRTGLGGRWLRFLATGAAGIGVQTCSLVFLREALGMSVMPVSAAAVEIAVLHNFFWHLRWTWAVPRECLTPKSVFERLWQFNLTNGMVSITTSLGVTRFCMEAFGLHCLAANLLAIGAGTLANFAAAELIVFRPHPGEKAERIPS
ncbi:MAG: GtrA family protein [Acidobacteria bacterium]|nr:GtrA family protein [Acidobacteriota bacterium]